MLFKQENSNAKEPTYIVRKTKEIKESDVFTNGIEITLLNGTQMVLTSDELVIIERICNKTYFRSYFRENVINALTEKGYDVDKLQTNNNKLLENIVEDYTEERYETNSGSYERIPWYEALNNIIRKYENKLKPYRGDK